MNGYGKGERMTSHELAKLLLVEEDLPVVLYANGHTHNSKFDEWSHGRMIIKPVQQTRFDTKTRTSIAYKLILIGHGSNCNL